MISKHVQQQYFHNVFCLLINFIGLVMESFLSSSTNEIGISTPNRRDTQRLKIRLSPILGQKALFRQSEFSDHGFLSSQSTAATICREFVQIILSTLTVFDF